jgi:hypothetical protein
MLTAGPRSLWLAIGALGGLATASCRGTVPAAPPQALATEPADPRTAAHQRLLSNLDTFHVAGAVKTSDDVLLPETIVIEIRSEICVESREPGARFWSLDYDTCFVYQARDTVDERGEYEVSVPCLDADAAYESRFAFGDLRLVQKGPVSFLAESDAGWKHQETFRSSRTQRRDLVLTLEPETFWVVREGAELRERARPESPVVQAAEFGIGLDVVRFHNGWAQVVLGRRMAWMEMRFLGTREEMEAARPFKGKPPVDPLRVDREE